MSWRYQDDPIREVHCLALGMPKSGTRYLTAVMKAADLAFEHEAMGRFGGINPRNWGHYDPRRVFQLVRHPLKVIASYNRVSWVPAFLRIRQAQDKSVIEYAEPERFAAQHGLDAKWTYKDPVGTALLWLRHNEWIQSLESRFGYIPIYQVERLEERWLSLMDHLGMPEVAWRGGAVPTNLGASQDLKPVSWADLGRFEEPVKKRAAQLGYDVG